MQHSTKKKLYTLLVIIGGIVLFLLLIYGREQPKKRPSPPPPIPLVETLIAHPVNHKLLVHTQGNVQPRREISLVAQVTGKIVSVSPSFADGSFFNANERLINIEQSDYLIAEQQAKARVADAVQLLAAERGRARQSKREWRDLGNKEANNLFLRKPQLASAQAALNSAKASLEKARLDIKRTVITAPFSGRIRKTLVNTGQYVTVGTKVATIYSTDIAEVRLPLTDRQIAMLDLSIHLIKPKSEKTPKKTIQGIPVRIQSQFGGDKASWPAHIVRTDASIDIESRQLFAVAEIQDPFGIKKNSVNHSSLNIGQFVDAYVEGKTVHNVLILPRIALRPQSRIWTIGADKRLHIKKVQVLQSHKNQVVVQDTFSGPQHVIVSNMSLTVEGMKVETKATNDNSPLSTPKSSSLSKDIQ